MSLWDIESHATTVLNEMAKKPKKSNAECNGFGKIQKFSTKSRRLYDTFEMMVFTQAFYMFRWILFSKYHFILIIIVEDQAFYCGNNCKNTNP